MSALCAILLSVLAAGAPDASFEQAKPVWAEGLETQINCNLGFRSVIEVPQDASRVELRITASSFYRAWITPDGGESRFIGRGPARGPLGYCRVDSYDLSKLAKPGKHTIALEVNGYNVDNYCVINQPSFCQAEVLLNGEVVAATGSSKRPFDALVMDYRVRRVPKYSSQRGFIEVYRLDPRTLDWRRKADAPFDKTSLTVQPGEKLIARNVPFPKVAETLPPVRLAGRGKMVPADQVNEEMVKTLTTIGLKRGGYDPSEHEVAPIADLMHLKTADLSTTEKQTGPFDLAPSEFQIVDFGSNKTGFVGATVTCETPVRFLIAFDEILTDGDVDYTRLYCNNVLTWELQPGTYAIESFDPYTLQVAKLIALDGSCRVESVHLRPFEHPEPIDGAFRCSDERLNKIYDAAVATFRQNGTDIFMDCPSRERAGWLCDSFFTARAGLTMCGNTNVERNFLQNYELAEAFPGLPEGMLPMCYPANHRPNGFIPNWALWFVVQLEEYLHRSGDRELVDALKPRVMGLFDYFEQLRNPTGLLEDLEGWVFIEWSKANDFTQDVNYPSNMLYTGAMEAAGRMYNRFDLLRQAGRLRAAIREQSFDGAFFIDNAKRNDRTLESTGNHTETCQYYAFYFDVADPESHPNLWKLVRDQLGPNRDPSETLTDVPPSNAFIGFKLRLEVLSRYATAQQVLDEVVHYYLHMAEKTGTLWEHAEPAASLNHGFASHIGHILFREALGVKQWEPHRSRLVVHFNDVELEHCKGELPHPAGPIEIKWTRTDNRLSYRIDAPDGYDIQVSADDGLQLETAR